MKTIRNSRRKSINEYNKSLSKYEALRLKYEGFDSIFEFWKTRLQLIRMGKSPFWTTGSMILCILYHLYPVILAWRGITLVHDLGPERYSYQAVWDQVYPLVTGMLAYEGLFYIVKLLWHKAIGSDIFTIIRYEALASMSFLVAFLINPSYFRL